jgi:hypothetical protein
MIELVEAIVGVSQSWQRENAPGPFPQGVVFVAWRLKLLRPSLENSMVGLSTNNELNTIGVCLDHVMLVPRLFSIMGLDRHGGVRVFTEQHCEWSFFTCAWRLSASVGRRAAQPWGAGFRLNRLSLVSTGRNLRG